MATAETTAETSAFREQLRSFHITGTGLDEWAAAPSLAGILCGKELAVPVELDSPFMLHAGALLAVRGPAREHFATQLRQAAERLEELLDLDASHAPDAVSADSLASALGPGADRFLSTANIVNALRRRVNPSHRMDAARRERCEKTARTLRAAISEAKSMPATVVFRGQPGSSLSGASEIRVEPDPCGAAYEYCQHLLTSLEGTLRALRVARLEIDDAFDAAHHDPMLSRFRWSAAQHEEIASLPPILVALEWNDLLATAIGGLSRILRSGFPVQILVIRPGMSPNAVRGEEPDIALLALSHREAYVVQGSAGAPGVLRAQLNAMARTIHPALAVVVTGEPASITLLAETAAWPLFTFEPNAKGTLRAGLRKDRAVNPQWTPAHAAALTEALRSHFRLIPETAEDDDQIELIHYLEQYQVHAPLAVPYIAVQGDDGRTRRLAVSRDMSDFCHDRLQAWQWVQDAVTVPAAPAVPAEPTAESSIDAMQQGAAQAVARAVALLTKQEA